MKKVRWEVVTLDGSEYGLYDYNTNTYLTSNGETTTQSYEFSTKEDAQEFLIDVCENNEDLAYHITVEKFVCDDIISEILDTYTSEFISVIVETLMEKEITFTRHDVVKVMRQIAGPKIEINYSDWKDYVIEAIEELLNLYGYTKHFHIDHYVYSFYDEVEEEIDEIEEDDEVEEIAEVEEESKSSDSATTTTINVSQDPKRHTLAVDFVRSCGGYPGASMDVLVCKGAIYIHVDPAQNAKDHIEGGRKPIRLHTKLKVDCYGNMRISKYMLDLAEIKIPTTN